MVAAQRWIVKPVGKGAGHGIDLLDSKELGTLLKEVRMYVWVWVCACARLCVCVCACVWGGDTLSRVCQLSQSKRD